MDEGYLNKPLQKTFTVIEFFDARVEALSTTEIAKKLGTTAGTIYPSLYIMETWLP